MGPIEKYGAAFLVSRACTGFSVFGATVMSIHFGFDVESLITSASNSLGFNVDLAGDISEYAGAMAAAAWINTLLLPVHIGLTVRALPLMYTNGFKSLENLKK